jgi:hypothetical protein
MLPVSLFLCLVPNVTRVSGLSILCHVPNVVCVSGVFILCHVPNVVCVSGYTGNIGHKTQKDRHW